MEYGNINELSVNELSDVLRKNGLDENLIKTFKVAEIDGEQFPTLTREEFCDMFKILRHKRGAIAVWSKVTGMEFDTNGNPLPQLKKSDGYSASATHIVLSSTPKPTCSKRLRIVPSSSESESESVNPSSTMHCFETTQDMSTDYSLVVKPSPLKVQKVGNTLTMQRDWSRNYKLPSRFSCAVEAGLTTKYLTPNLINEMVRDICTSMLNYSSHPNKKDRETVAQLVVKTYPFLKDPPINEDTKPWGSWQMKIQNRFKKLQRKKSVNTSNNGIASEGGRPKKKNESCWTVVPTETETADNIHAFVASIKKEWKKGRKDHGKIKELMEKTYVKRRELVIVDVKPIVEIVNMFPPLRNMLYIKADLAKLMGQPELPVTMKNSFKDIWSVRLLAYGKSQPKCEKAMQAMEQAIDGGCHEEECKERTALKLAQHIFRVPNKKGVQCTSSEEAVVKIVMDDQSLDNVIKDQIQPVTLLVDDLYQSNIMYVVAEGVVLCEITTKKIKDAIVVLLATYYLFNMEHKQGKNIYCFLDMALMSIVPEKCAVSVKSIIGVLSNVA